MRRCVSIFVVLLTLAGSGIGRSLPAIAQGQVYTDTMDSEATGLLATESDDPAITYAYQNGQFVAQASEPSFQGELTSYIAVPEMASSRLTVDVAVGGDPNGKYVLAGCRASDTADGYALGVAPATGEIILFRVDPGDDVVLARTNDPNLVNPGNASNQIGIDCWTNVITGFVNGEPVLSTFDDTYASGGGYIAAGAGGDQTDGLMVAYDNLSITDNGNLALGPETPTPPSAALPAIAPTFAAPPPVAPTEATTGELTQIRDPRVDPGGTLSDSFTISMELPPAVSGISGDTEVEIDTVSKLPSGAQVADFYAEFHYLTPTLPANTAYLVGFCFWVDPAGSCYDIYLEDNGTGAATWGYGHDPSDGAYQSLGTGSLPHSSVDPTPGADNFLSLTVYQGIAILSGNTFSAAAVIPLQGTPIVGDVWAEVGFLSTAEAGTAAPLPVSLTDLSVWDLFSGLAPVAGEPSAAATEQPAPSPTAATLPTVAPTVATLPTVASGPAVPPIQASGVLGPVFERERSAALAHPPFGDPLSGDLTQVDNRYVWATSGHTAADFYTIVTFVNPIDLSTPSDIGIGFRDDTGPEAGFRFILTSNGDWYIEQAGQTPYDSGVALGFDSTPGASNVVELIAHGATGLVAVNGVVLKQIDLSAVNARGEVYIGSGFLSGNTVPNRVVRYLDWWVYPIDILDIKSG